MPFPVFHSWKKYLLFLFLINTLPLQAQTAHEICRTWQYVSIYTIDGREVRKIGHRDLMVLRKKGKEQVFSYFLQLEKVKSSGTWILQDSTLEFTYTTGKSGDRGNEALVRKFRILEVNDEKLLLQETGLRDQPGLFFSYTSFKP
ncbi:MAG: hypothetical protein JNL88_10300 [Bacteroidia bacterium]|nr:hypothetical protein [Bacteroidia bacterium]